MSTDLLSQHFDTIATSPDGIARMRKLILQLAVQGKLGTQDAGDEPLDEIIKKIQKQNQKLNGKKGNFSKIEDSELYFTIPEKWSVLRLGEICSVRAGGTPDRKNPAYWENGTIPWIKIQDIKEKYVTETSEYITEEGLKNSSAFLMETDTILYTIFATIGKAGILKFKACCNQAIVGIKPNEDIISKDYLYLHLIAIQSYYAQLSRGMAQNNINQTILKNAPLYLPPLAEQHRIVTKVDRLMALCDELEARQKEERAGCLKLGTASLAGLQNAASPEEFERQWTQVCDAFDLILDCPENVDVLRKTILQLGVMGKLRTQVSTDEPVGKLLANIRKKKIKLINERKLKASKPSEKENRYPQSILPSNWEWVSLENICEIINDGTHVTPSYSSKGIPFLSVGNLKGNSIDFTNCKFISIEDHIELTKRCKPEKYDILLGKVGSTIGVCDVITHDEEFSIFVQLALLKPFKEFIDSHYVKYTILSRLVQDQILIGSAGSAMPYIGVGRIQSIVIPLPPLAEQHRIVAKVDALMALCDALESRLKERAAIQTKFTEAVVKNVGTGLIT